MAVVEGAVEPLNTAVVPELSRQQIGAAISKLISAHIGDICVVMSRAARHKPTPVIGYCPGHLSQLPVLKSAQRNSMSIALAVRSLGQLALRLSADFGRIVVAVLLGTSLVACDSEPRDVPGMGSRMNYYPSRSMDDITIRFEQANLKVIPGLQRPGQTNTITLPRAYVYAVDGYQRSRVNRDSIPLTLHSALPTKVVSTGAVRVLIASPAGEPFMLTRKSNDFPAGSNPSVHGGVERRGIISAVLHNSPNRGVKETWRKLRTDRLAAQINDGAKETSEFNLTRVSSLRSSIYYYNKDSDREFVYVVCPMNSQAVYFCTSHMILNDEYYVEASFVDFRFAGGREFLDRRIGAIRKALCPYVKCD